MRRADVFCAAAVLVGVITWTPNVSAGVSELNLQAIAGLWAGTLRDGMELARVRLSYPDSHCGFQVWSDAPLVNGQPGRYVLQGKHVPGQKLHVRLTGSDWQPDTMGRKGLVLDSGEASVTLMVVADGDQAVQPETWPLLLHGAATGCR